MTFKRAFDFILKYWWIYALSCVLLSACEIYVVINNIYIYQLRYVILYVLMIMMAVLFVAWIVSLFKKRYALFFFAIPASVLLCGFITFPTFALYALGTAGEGDTFGKDHPIPEGLRYTEPFESMEEESVDSLDSTTWLRIHQSSQGGIYNYAYFGPSLHDGYIYLKCFEATENIPLSDDTVGKRTHNPVKDHSSFGLVGGTGYFMIYEGSFEDYYAVRVEVWHHEDATGEERLLNQKVYKMEGWQR